MSERGCGKRKKGAIYFEAEVGNGPGTPWWHYLIDPLIPVTDEQLMGMGIGAQGQHLYDGNIYDMIGKKWYPLPADWLEEGIRINFSRRFQKNFPFEKITDTTNIIFLHAQAPIFNLKSRWKYAAEGMGRFNGGQICPFGRHNHGKQEACAGLMWFSGTGSTDEHEYRPFPPSAPTMNYRIVGGPRTARYGRAMFYRLPIRMLKSSGFVVVDDPDDAETVKENLATLNKAGFEANVVEE